MGSHNWVGWKGVSCSILSVCSEEAEVQGGEGWFSGRMGKGSGYTHFRLVLPTKPYFLFKLTSSRVKDRFLLSMQNTSWGNGVMIGLDGQVYLHFKNVRTLWDK